MPGLQARVSETPATILSESSTGSEGQLVQDARRFGSILLAQETSSDSGRSHFRRLQMSR